MFIQSKDLDLEFIARDALVNAILDVGVQKAFLMVPLTLRMKYKGFKCLMEPTYMFEQGAVAFGKKESEVFYQTAELQDVFSKIGGLLKLKNHSVKGKVAAESASGEIYLSQSMQVTMFPKLSFEDLVIHNNERFKQETVKLGLTDGSIS